MSQKADTASVLSKSSSVEEKLSAVLKRHDLDDAAKLQLLKAELNEQDWESLNAKAQYSKKQDDDLRGDLEEAQKKGGRKLAEICC